jgi:1-acyl-sn-glycerol-3-phosphate acyltransferase
MIVFPEGTRGYTGEPLQYLGGVYKIPQKFFLNIQPITIMGTELITSK